MAILNSLEIQGIRSFPLDRPECIYFEKPLTLIVGHNGAGKTTLVECLKMVTGGIFPPNSDKGKSFVHDSKFNKMGEVRAHIRLDFSTITNDHVSAKRCYTISRDKNFPKKSNFRVSENILEVKPHTGEKTCISMKSSDMDVAVPSLMGLTRAIIDSVAFCHQDETNWALDEFSKVKSRFDDLLETFRYTKALAALNKARKEQEEAINSKKAQINVYKCQILQVVDLKNQLAFNEEEIAKTNSEIIVLEDGAKKATDAIINLKKEHEIISDTLNRIDVIHNEITTLNEEIEKLHQSMSEIYNEPLADVERYHTVLIGELESSEKKYDENSKAIDALMDSLNEIHRKLEGIDVKANEYAILKETLKTAQGNVYDIKEELAKELGTDDVEAYSESHTAKIVESMSVDTFQEYHISELLKACSESIAELEQKIFEITADQGASNIVINSLDDEINTLQLSISDLDLIRLSFDENKENIAKFCNEIEDNNNALKELLAKKESLIKRAIKMRNMIPEIDPANKDDIESAIKFLSSILSNDKESISAYLCTISGKEISEEKIVEIISRLYDEIFGAKKFQKESPDKFLNLCDSPEFFRHCIEAICQMIRSVMELSIRYSTPGEEMCNVDNLDISEYEEPYHALVKIVTNVRIKEYIAHYKSLICETENMDKNDHETTYLEVKNMIAKVDKDISSKEDEIKNISRIIDIYKRDYDELALKLCKAESLHKKLSDARSQRDRIINNVESGRERLEPIRERLSRKRDEHEQLEARLADLKQNRAVRSSKISTLLERLNEANLKVERAKVDLECAIQTNTDGVDELRFSMVEITEKIKNKRNEQAKQLQNIKNQRLLLRMLDQNIDLNTKQKRLYEAQTRMKELKHKIGPNDLSEIELEIQKMTEICEETCLKIATMKGTILTRDENITKIKQALDSDALKDVQKKYMETYIDLRSHVMAKDDLEKYCKLLEKGLHSYHTRKIADINAILKRIWREVYTGNQIDYITIRSNADETSAAYESSKSYSYRIVMVTSSGIDMDMRGHCSAGERVLASIIIRLALTESFCSDCTVLTLDEPTAHLDKDNMESLEVSLSRLVNEHTTNFQLILITHDESFARRIATHCSCDKYFRIEKNSKNESVINKIHIGSNP